MTGSAHPSRQELADFVSGQLSANETRSIVRHLLAGCRDCKQITSEYWPARAPADETIDGELHVDLALLESREEQVAAERESADDLFKELSSHPQHRRMLLAVNSQRFHNWFVTELVLEKTRELCFKEPSEALLYGELGVAIADRLPGERYGSALVHDMRARALGNLGNARRVSSDLTGATDAFQQARELLESGSGDPLEEARLMNWESHYWMVKREYQRALRLCDRVIATYRSLGDRHLTGVHLLNRGVFLGASGDYEAAIEAFEQCLEDIDAEREPRMYLVAKHNLSTSLLKAGDAQAATEIVEELLPLYAKQDDQMLLLKLRLLEGRLALAQRQFRRAEGAFREVKEKYLSLELPFGAAGAGFDLAMVLLEEGRFKELEELATELLTVFQSLGIARETIAALELFQTAVAAQNVSLSWISELASYMATSKTKPGTPFLPSSK